MKQLLLTLTANCMLLTATAQDPGQALILSGQDAANWLQQVTGFHAWYAPRISKSYVLHPPETPVPATFMDTLLTWDWLELGDYWYKTNTFSTEFNQVNYEYNFRRFGYGGQEILMEGGSDFPDEDPEVEDRFPNSTRSERVVFKNGYAWMVDHEGSYARIVSYNDGIMIVDHTRGGRVEDMNSASRFRNVWVAIPKLF